MITQIFAGVGLYILIAVLLAFVLAFDAGFWETLPTALLWPVGFFIHLAFRLWWAFTIAGIGYFICVLITSRWGLWW